LPDLDKNTKKWEDQSTIVISDIYSELASLREDIKLKNDIELFKATANIYKEKNLCLSNLEEFVKQSMDINSSLQQGYVKRDSQYDNLITCLHQIINKDIILVDFGCGPHLNLMRQILDYKELDDDSFEKNITYYGLDEFSFIAIDPDQFDVNIVNFNNSDKELSNVFYQNYSKLYNDLFMRHSKHSDIVIVKNVNHEVRLIDLPNFIKKVFGLVDINSIIIFYDLSDIAEPLCFPWNKIMYERIFKEFLKCRTDYLPFHEADKRVALHMCRVDILNKMDFSLLELRMFLQEVFTERIIDVINEKNKYINGDRSHQNETFEKRITNFTKLISYHSNLEQQLREAKEEWDKELLKSL